MWAPFWFVPLTVGSPTFGLCILPHGVRWKFPPFGSQPFCCVDPYFGLWFPRTPHPGVRCGSPVDRAPLHNLVCVLCLWVSSPRGIQAPPPWAPAPLYYGKCPPPHSRGATFVSQYVLPLLCTACSSHRVNWGRLRTPCCGLRNALAGIIFQQGL